MRWFTVVLVAMAAFFTAPVAYAAPAVEIIDQADILSDSDEDMLRTQTPDVAERVVYLTFATNDSNLNDTVLDYGLDERPDLLNESQNKYAPGLLLVTVGMSPRQMGVYCGDDVCSEIEMYSSGRLDGILDEMEPALKGGNYAVGMLDGAKAAADTSVKRTEMPGWLAFILFAAGFFGLIGVVLWIIRFFEIRGLKRKLEYMREHQADVATRLDAIDIRAHSLTSPLADDALRSEWLRIKNAFTSAHKVTAFQDNPSGKDLMRNKTKIEAAHDAVLQTENAEDNIELLYSMEHGDADVRRRQLTELKDDIYEARITAGGTKGAKHLVPEFEQLETKTTQLRDEALDSEDFITLFVAILREYGTLTDYLSDALYAESEVKREYHSAPRLGEATWSPGVGQFYTPFSLVNSWHSSDSAAQSSSSSSSANTSYSSSSFSGGGGSRGF